MKQIPTDGFADLEKITLQLMVLRLELNLDTALDASKMMLSSKVVKIDGKNNHLAPLIKIRDTLKMFQIKC